MQLAIYLDVRQRTCVNLKVDGVLQRTGSFDHFGLNIDIALGNTIHTKQWNVCQGDLFSGLTASDGPENLVTRACGAPIGAVEIVLIGFT